MIFVSLSIFWIRFRPIMIWGRSYAICCRLSPLSILHQWDFQRGGRTRNCGKSGKLKQKIKNIPKSLQISNNLRKFAALEPAKPLIEAQMCGSFFICEKDYDMATTIPFTKTYTSPAHLVQLLKARGLSIHNNQKAEHYLQYIGYYRLSAYMYPLLNTKCRSTSSSPRHPSGK